MLSRAGVVMLAVLAAVGGFATWQFVALVLSATAFVLALAAIVLARDVRDRIDEMQEGQAARITRLEQPDSGG